MAYAAAWVAICEDPFGEPIRPRLSIRLNDGTGGAPSTLVEIGHLEILDLNPISFKRDTDFGIIEGQAWQVRITNVDLGLLDYDLHDCWCALEAGFVDADLWELMAQGRIAVVTASSDFTMTIEVHDAVMDAVNYQLTRDMYIGPGWASEIITQNTAETSSGYDNAASGAGISYFQGDANVYFADETFKIVFTTATAFDVIWEDGTTAASGTISSDLTVAPAANPTDNCITINAEGWDTTTGAYAAGDEFVFYTSKFRDATDRTPVKVIQGLLEDVAALQGFDVLAGVAYTSPCYDTTNWAAIDAENDTYSVSGEWAKGTQVSEMIQDALKLIHGAIYTAPTGQAAIWAVSPSQAVIANLNGNPGSGTINLLSGSVTRDMDDVANEVTYEFLDAGGRDAVYEASDPDSQLHAIKTATVRVGWRCPGPLVEAAAGKYINRFKSQLRVYDVETTLAGAVAAVGAGLTITDASLGADSDRVDAGEVTLDLLANSVRIRAWSDPVITQNYAIVGTSTVGGAGVVW